MISATVPRLLDGAGDAYHASGLVWRRGHGLPAAKYSSGEREVFSPCAAAALYRRSDLIEIGGFDEDFFCYVEDVDLGFRLRLAGFRCLYVPGAIVHHVGSATAGKNSVFCIYHGHRNLVWTFFKNMPMPLMALLLPAHLLLNLFSIVWYTCAGQSGTVVRSKLDALRGIPAMRRKRIRIQAEKRVRWQAIFRVLNVGLADRLQSILAHLPPH
jgi:GT2 family glycosyltransferase